MVRKLLRVLKLTFRVLFIAPIVGIYLYLNIAHYAVYYGAHMKHKEGTHPEYAMLLEYLWCNEVPIERYYYDYDGSSTIYIDTDDGWTSYISEFSDGYDFSLYKMEGILETGSYVDHDIDANFNKKFEFEDSSDVIRTSKDWKSSREHLDPPSEEEIMSLISKYFQPALDYRLNREPPMNLQFLFDLIYGPRFQ